MSFSTGDQVRSLTDSVRIGVVRALDRVHGGIQYYRVFWGGTTGTLTVPETDLIAQMEVGRPSEALARGIVTGYADFQRLITFHRLSRESPLRNNIYAFNASRTRFFPFQFKPLIKLLDSPSGRLLICDEVGLGKTIEAGLILLEERARRRLRLVLVVCPAGLRAKWQLELRRRFDERFDILDARALRAFLDEYAADPERTQLAGIVSLETMRGATDLLEEVAPAFDLLIVDEAHHLRNFGTQSRDAVVAVSQGADTVILMTATPVHLGTDNLFSLLNILDPREFPDEFTAEERFRQNAPVVAAQRLVGQGRSGAMEALSHLEEAVGSPWLREHPFLEPALSGLRELQGVSDPSRARALVVRTQQNLAELNLLSHIFSRTRKRDVKMEAPVRKANAWTVQLTTAEAEFYRAVSTLVLDQRKRLGDSARTASWALNTLQRRMASSIPATVQHYREAGAVLGPPRPEDDEPELGSADGLEIPGDFRSSLGVLMSRWPDDARDSKWERLHALLTQLSTDRPDAKTLVFAFFKGTLRYLSRSLTAEGIDHVLIDGDVPPDERELLIARFRDARACRVMLSSRVGSEGLDFQFCDTVVNYDLPWNPMEVEQRIGRLDRIGQPSKCIWIFNLWTEGTIEQRILQRLYERIGVFEHSIGELDAVIGEVMKELEEVLLRPGLSPVEQEKEAERIARVIEQEQLQLTTLESQAASFIGVDAFFEDEIATIRRNRRFLTGQQLLRFLEDYLQLAAPRSRMTYDPVVMRGHISPDQGLQDLIKKHHRAADLVRFMGGGAGGIPFTVEPEVAFNQPGIEFINVLHPLLEVIRSDYAERLNQTSSAQYVTLSTTSIPPGVYFLVVYRLRVEGVRPATFLEAVILDAGLRPVGDRDMAEALLGELVERGEEPTFGGAQLDPRVAEQIGGVAEQVFLDRLEVLRAEFQRRNGAVADRKLASVRFQKERQITTQRHLLEHQLAQGKPERVLQLARGKIRRLEADLHQQVVLLETHRHVETGHDEIAAAVVEISPP